MENCIFCKIAAGQAPTTLVYEDEESVVIQDIHPVAPLHLLVIPRRHADSLNAMDDGDEALLGRLLLTARKVALQTLGENAHYRLVINTGAQAGQTIFHLHLHIISGEPYVSHLFTRGVH